MKQRLLSHLQGVRLLEIYYMARQWITSPKFNLFFFCRNMSARLQFQCSISNFTLFIFLFSYSQFIVSSQQANQYKVVRVNDNLSTYSPLTLGLFTVTHPGQGCHFNEAPMSKKDIRNHFYRRDTKLG